MAQVSLPPGFRFHPTDVELVMYYLKRKVMEKRIPFDVITEIDIYKFGPWDLPDKSCLRSKDLEWYFFCPRERKYSNGARMNRATEYGYWKTTGKDRTVVYNKRTVGMIKTLVFHKGKAPRGDRTDWVIYEYRLEDKDLADAGVAQDGYVICKIFQKSGPGPKNGAQYGAPFNEEEWMDDGEATCAIDESFPLASLPAPTPVIQKNQNSSIVTGTLVSGAMCNGSSSESCPTTAQTLDRMLPEVLANDDVSMLDPDISFMLDMFTVESFLVPDETNENENLPMGLQAVHMVANDIYNDLGDLGKWAELNEDGYNITTGKNTEMPVNQQFVSDDTSYLELNDLKLPLEYPSNSQGFEPALTDSVPSYFGSCSKSEQHYYPGSYVQHVPAPVGSSVQSEGFCGFQNNLNVFQKDNIIEENANQGYRGYKATLNNSGLPAWQ